MFKIATALVGATAAVELKDKPTFKEYFDMTQGMMMGLGYSPEQIVNGKFQFCVVDAETILIDVASGVADLAKFDMADLMDFVHSLGAAYYKLGEALQDCLPFTSEEGSENAFKKISHVKLILEDPKSLVIVANKNLYVNGNNIYPELLSAQREFNEGEWGNAGYFLGEAAKKSLHGKDSFEQLEKAYGEQLGASAGADIESVQFTM